MSDILVIGSSMYDLFTYTDHAPQGGETLEANHFAESFGGKGANQAIAAAKLGANVAMLTALGDDNFGKQMLQNFETHQISTENIHMIKGSPSGIATIIVEKSGQNRILIVKGANDHLTKKHVDQLFEKQTQAKLLVLQLEINLNVVYYAIEKAAELNIPILLNPAPAHKDLSLDKISSVDFFVPNETELELLTHMPVSSHEEIEKAAQFLIEKGMKEVIVTLGSKGALYVNKDHSKHYPAPKVKAIDTTGAGDAFIGAFSCQYIKDQDIEKAIPFAIEYASQSVQKKGTQSSYGS